METVVISYDGSAISTESVTLPITVGYNNSTIATINDRGIKTLNCKDCIMSTDATVGSVTLDCEGYPMKTDVTIVTSGSDFATNYNLLEYIQSTKTQYINLGNITNGTNVGLCKAVVDCQYLDTTEFPYGPKPFGSSNSSTGFWAAVLNGSTGCIGCIGTTRANIAKNNTSRHIWTLDQVNDSFTIDELTLTVGGTSGDTSNDLYVFARCHNGSVNANSIGTMKLFSFKFYVNNVLTLDLVPAKRKQDLVAGLYDLINETFYTNQGTGTFVEGPIINS